MFRKEAFLREWLFGSLLVAITMPVVAEPAVRLSKKQQAELTQSVLPAYQLGDPTRLLEKLSAFVVKLDDARLAATDDWLVVQGLPNVGQMLANSRLTMVEQNRAAELPLPHPRELLVTLREFNTRIDEVLSEQDKHPVMSDPLLHVESLSRYQDLFWETHVLDNRLNNAANIARYADELTKLAAKRLNLNSLDDEGRELIETDFGEIVADIARRQQELEEREIELRIARVADAEAVLTDSLNTRERFLAAYALDLDGSLIAEFFKQRGAEEHSRFLRQQLADPTLPEAVDLRVQRGRQRAGALVEKTQLLYTGLHWWLRGRYGAGPEAFGLLKSRQSLVSEQAQFPLYMPQTMPKPTAPATNAVPVPQVERRHHYTWTAEYRPIQTSYRVSTTGSTTYAFRGQATTTTMSHFY